MRVNEMEGILSSARIPEDLWMLHRWAVTVSRLKREHNAPEPRLEYDPLQGVRQKAGIDKQSEGRQHK
jgi:hypothetical protein